MTITNWAIRHSVAVFVLMVILVGAGALSYQSMPRESFPDVEIPFVVISTVYVGVSGQDIETLVTTPIENELQRVRDVRQMTSTSIDNASIIVLEFEPIVRMDVALQRVRDRVDQARAELPAAAEDPEVAEISFSDFPVLLINMSGDVGIARLQRLAEDLQERIERIPGVLDAMITGGVERQILIELDRRALDAHEMSINEVLDAIQSENVNIPGGTLDIGDQRFVVRTPGEVEDWRELENIVVRSVEDRTILVSDVATVRDGFADRETLARLGGMESITLGVTRRAGDNILRITDDVKALSEAFSAEIGDAVTFTFLADQSDDVRSSVNELENNILTGLILVASLLLFFMGGFRNALFVAISIPMSMLTTFTVLALLGITLNMVTLFSLVLALGLLVDNGIVVVENIYRQANTGKPLEQAAMDGVAEVGWPVIASTATTIAAFFPMLFWPGIIGQFMFFLPATVITVLCASLFTALVILPVISARFMRVPPRTGDQTDEMQGLPDNFLYRAYSASLRLALRLRWLTVTGVMILFIAILVLYGRFNAGAVFFPDTTPETLIVNVALPDGANLQASDRVTRIVEDFLANAPDVVNFIAEIGAGTSGNEMGGGGNTPHESRITIDLLAAEEQTRNPRLLMQEIRDLLADVPDVTYEVIAEQGGPPTGDPINIEVTGDDYLELGRVAQHIRDLLADVDGVVDLTDDFASGRSEITLRVDRHRASLVGARTSDIASAVRAAMNGVEVSTFREAGEEYDIVVRFQPQWRMGVEDVRDLTITTRTGARVALAEMADISVEPGLGAVRRINAERVVTVSGDVADGYNNAERLAAVQRHLDEQLQLPPGVTIRYTGESEDQEETQQFLGLAMLSALALIALILITQFNSLIQPFIIMFTVVLSLMGVLVQLMVFQEPFVVVMTGMAVISLAGVVVNNSIVLTEFINNYRARGHDMMDAAWRAGMVRLRPVLLSAFTTSSSLIPTVLGIRLEVVDLSIATGGTSVEFWGPMARAIVVGLIVAAFLTLIVVPVLYVVLEGSKDWLLGLFQRLRQGTNDDPPPSGPSNTPPPNRPPNSDPENGTSAHAADLPDRAQDSPTAPASDTQRIAGAPLTSEDSEATATGSSTLRIAGDSMTDSDERPPGTGTARITGAPSEPRGSSTARLGGGTIPEPDGND